MEQPIADLDQAVSVFITTYFDVMADDGKPSMPPWRH